MKLKKEATQKRYEKIRAEFVQYRKANWTIGRALDRLCEKHGLSFQTIARYCGFR